MNGFVEGNAISLLRSGSVYFPALEAAVDGAELEVYIETYIFEDDVTGRRIAQALMRAARRGVIVHLLLDGFGCKSFSGKMRADLGQAGVRVLTYRPDISPWTFRRERLRRLHRKIVVVDARIAFVGGINIIDDLHTPHQVPPRFDYAVRVEGPLLAEIYPAVTRLWKLVVWSQLREQWPSRELPVSAERRGDQRAALVVRDNLRHRNDIEGAYLTAIAAAHSEIVIACAYFFPGRSFRRALIEAAARGVRVVLLLQRRVEYLLLHYASRALYRAFLDGGVEIQEYHRGFLHAKVAVIDEQWATVGSSNIDPMSLLLAREANIVVDDTSFARELRQSLGEAMASGAKRVEPARWKMPVSSRFMTWLCYGLVRFLTGWSSYGRATEFR
jgi:cardiolipin synthase A/B